MIVILLHYKHIYANIILPKHLVDVRWRWPPNADDGKPITGFICLFNKRMVVPIG